MNLSDILPEIIAAVRAKKEVSAVEEEWIRERIILMLEKRKEIGRKIETTKSFAQFSRSREYEMLLKSIRADLHAVYGTFQQQLATRRNAFEELKKAYRQKESSDKVIELHRKILSTHTSTKERLDIYSILYKRLFAKIGIPNVLLDVSCGLNPFSYPWMQTELVYNATEITAEDCRMIKEYFHAAGINGEVVQLDVIKEKEKLNGMKADVCFLWKLLDTLEYLERGISKKILPIINATWMIVSFSTKTLSGKRMKKTRRLWFERICEENGWKIDVEEFENELFYIVRK